MIYIPPEFPTSATEPACRSPHTGDRDSGKGEKKRGRKRLNLFHGTLRVDYNLRQKGREKEHGK